MNLGRQGYKNKIKIINASNIDCGRELKSWEMLINCTKARKRTSEYFWYTSPVRLSPPIPTLTVFLFGNGNYSLIHFLS